MQNLIFFTIKFSDGSLSPPAKTYDEEPVMKRNLPTDQEITSIAFHTQKTRCNFCLYAVMVCGRNDEKLLSIMPIDYTDKHHRVQKFDLNRGERIVSARVDVDSEGWYASRIAFLVCVVLFITC